MKDVLTYTPLRPSPLRGSEGFTLLEMIVALTIMGLMVTVLLGSLRLGQRAWEEGEERLATYQRIRIVLDKLGQQIKSTLLEVNVEEKGLTPFEGGSHSLKFVSSISLMDHERGGPYYVHYLYRDRSLVIYEWSVTELFKLVEDSGDESKTLEEIEQGLHPIPLFAGLEDVAFDYLTGIEEGEWREEWSLDEEDDLPIAVRISLRYTLKGETYTTSVALPILISEEAWGGV